MATPSRITLVQRVPKSVDLETHIRLVQIDSLQIVEFIDYIPSLGEYGRGYYVPKDDDRLTDIIGALVAIVEGSVKV
jgi:hypothetical protein